MMIPSWPGARRLACALGLAFATSVPALAQTAGPEEAAPGRRLVHQGVAVDFALLPAASGARGEPREGESARFRFTFTDVTTGGPLTSLRPAAWLSRRAAGGARPQTCAEKIREFLGGSIFAQAELDLNTFRVIALNDDATLTVVDPLFGFGGTKLLALVPLASPGTDWALGLGGRRLFVTQPEAGKVAVVDTASWQVAAQIPVDGRPGRALLQPDGHYLWVARDGEPGGMAVLDADSAEVAASIETGRGPHTLAVSAGNLWAFVTNEADRTLSVIDIRRLQKIKDLPLGGRPASIAFSQLGDAVYVTVTDGTTGGIVVVDAAKHEIVSRIETEPGADQIRFAPGDRFGLVANPVRNHVLVLDAAVNRIVQRTPVDSGPEQFAFSSDMAFVRRRDSPVVVMLPLKEIGREGQPLAVAEFPGGEAPFGPRTAFAAGLVAAPGETAVVVANPADKAIYYYMEGMAAPMGNFGNYGRSPRAVQVLDRSLHEVAPGVYETSAVLPAAGAYDVVFFLDAPRIAHCFEATIPADPARAADRRGSQVTLQLAAPLKLVAGTPARAVFRIKAPAAGASVALPPDLTFLAVLAPGVWHLRQPAILSDDGTAAFDFTPPEAGLYYVYAESRSLGGALNRAPVLVLEAAAAPNPSTP